MYTHIRTSNAPTYGTNCLIMSVQNLYTGCSAFSSAGRLLCRRCTLREVVMATGIQPLSIYFSLLLSCYSSSHVATPLLHIWIGPLLLIWVTPKKHFSKLRRNSGHGRCFIMGRISPSRWIRYFMQAVFEVLCVFF